MISTQQMTNYLKIATQMESDAYACRSVVNKLKQKISTLNSTVYYDEGQYTVDKIKENARTKSAGKMSGITKVYIICILLTCFVFGVCPLVIALKAGVDASYEAKYALMLVPGIVFQGSIIFLVIALRRRRLRKNNNIKMTQLQEKYNQSNIKKERNTALLANYQVQLNNAISVMNRAQDNLKTLYAENILPYQYRNLAAVSTMYQWLSTGRCLEIYGHGGLYDTYEYDLRLGSIIGNLEELNRKMDVVMQNQNILINEVQRSNQIAERTYKSITSIENKVGNIESNAERIKANTDIIAMNTTLQTRYQAYGYYHSQYYR